MDEPRPSSTTPGKSSTSQALVDEFGAGSGGKISFGAPVIITRAIWRGEC